MKKIVHFLMLCVLALLYPPFLSMPTVLGVGGCNFNDHMMSKLPIKETAITSISITRRRYKKYLWD